MGTRRGKIRVECLQGLAHGGGFKIRTRQLRNDSLGKVKWQEHMPWKTIEDITPTTKALTQKRERNEAQQFVRARVTPGDKVSSPNKIKFFSTPTKVGGKKTSNRAEPNSFLRAAHEVCTVREIQNLSSGGLNGAMFIRMRGQE